jgi:hypothetical protein
VQIATHPFDAAAEKWNQRKKTAWQECFETSMRRDAHGDKLSHNAGTATARLLNATVVSNEIIRACHGSPMCGMSRAEPERDCVVLHQSQHA